MFKLYKENIYNNETITTSYFMKYQNKKYKVCKPNFLQRARAKEIKSLEKQKYDLVFLKKKSAKKHICNEFNELCCLLEPELQKEQHNLEKKLTNKRRK